MFVFEIHVSLKMEAKIFDPLPKVTFSFFGSRLSTPSCKKKYSIVVFWKIMMICHPKGGDSALFKIVSSQSIFEIVRDPDFFNFSLS